jgi:hypothetical protein
MSDINRYNSSKIYTIRCKLDNSLIYVGSTIQALYKRWDDHKRSYKYDKYKNILLYIKINELGIDNFYIELYENYNCNNKEELLKKEGEVIRLIGTLNKKIEGRTRKEYRQSNKYKEYNKQYLENNKDRIKQYQQSDKYKEYKKQYKENNKEKIKEWRENNKEKIKEWYLLNKERIKECYLLNKDEINEKKRLKRLEDKINNLNINK